MSSITRAELQFGVARRPGATKLAMIVDAFLTHMRTEPWDEAAADRYGVLRADLERRASRSGRWTR